MELKSIAFFTQKLLIDIVCYLFRMEKTVDL